MERNAQLHAEREQQEAKSQRVHAQWLAAQAATKTTEAEQMMQESAACTAANKASMEARTAALRSQLNSRLASIKTLFAAQSEAFAVGRASRVRDAAPAAASVQQSPAGRSVTAPSRGDQSLTTPALVTAEVVDPVELAPADPVTVAGPLIAEPAPKTASVPWRSSLRRVKAKSDSVKVQQRIVGLAEVEETYRDGGFIPDAEFEQHIKGFGIDEQFLRHYGSHLQPEMRGQLTLHLAGRRMAAAEYETVKDLKSAAMGLHDQRVTE